MQSVDGYTLSSVVAGYGVVFSVPGSLASRARDVPRVGMALGRSVIFFVALCTARSHD
jgi:hypothetical protein